MKIITCIKQVPDVIEIRFDPETRTLVREGVRNLVNPFDRPAVALAVDLMGRFVVATMGPPQARSALVEALASGIDRALHLCDRAFAGADTLATARALAAAIRQEGFDLILCGKHTVDGETAQVGPELATLLDVPHVSGVTKVLFADDGTTLTCTRESDEGHEIVETRLPCLLTCAEELMPPVVVRKPALDAAQSKPISELSAADLGLAPGEVGAAGSPTWVAEVRVLPEVPRAPVQMLSGPPEEVARELAAVMRRVLVQARPPAAPALPPPPAVPPKGEAICVVVELERGALAQGTRELLGEAAVLAAGRHPVLAIAIGGGAQDELAGPCGAAGADELVSLAHPALATYSSEIHAAALCQAIEELRPATVLMSASERGRDLLPRVAARLGLGLTGDAIGLSLDEAGRLVMLKPAFSGSIVAPILSRTRPQMATVRPGMLPARQPDPQRSARHQVLLPGPLPPSRTRLAEAHATLDEGAARLLAARAVVGVGMGIGDPSHLPLARALAEALGGALAATRRVADAGWLPRQIQVGLTGRVIAPDLYVALGVRGVQNHAIGIRRAGTIVAINADPRAPIFQLATCGVVADVIAFVPLLTRALQGAT
jgi:electron transfer flavoprotein alpha subunit